MTHEEIEKIIEPYLKLPLECDGMSRVISHLLDKNKIQHSVPYGFAHYGEHKVVHIWIELSDGYIIDYKSKMWFGALPGITEGIFRRKKSMVVYEQRNELLHRINSVEFAILTMPFPNISRALSSDNPNIENLRK